MAKAVGNLVMHLTVDDSKVTPTINTMKQQLRDLNATWRANVDAAKAAGDSQEAARAKAEGLALAMSKQKEILASMNTIMRNTGERTDSNALAYDRMTSSIGRAEAQYKNLSNQEQAALVILDKQETGIDELNRSIKANDDLTQSQIKALKQQGDEFGANELKVNSLKNKQQSLNEAQEKEEQILKNIVARSGENSRAYTEQATAVQHAKNNIAENNNELLKYNKRIESTAVQLKELKSSYSSIKEAQDSYITRLKAEGHQNEASVADLKKLKMAYANLGEQYKLQMTQLNSSSVGTKGYQEAYVAANKTATEMSRVASQSRNTQNEINKMNPYGISKIGSALNNASNAGDLMGKKVVGAYHAIRRNAAAVVLSVGIAGGALLKGAQTATEIQNSYVKTNNLLVTGGEKQKIVTDQVSQMQKDGAKYATEYGYSQQSIADGYEELVKRGYDGAQSIGSMKNLMQGARATGDDYSDVVRNTATALENFNMRSDDTNKMMENTKIVTNQMAYAADLTATRFSSLGKAMEYVGPSAHKSGVSLSETASAIGILSNNGLEASKAGTGLRMVLNRLTSETPAGIEALKGLGLSTKDFVDTSGKLKPVNEIFGILNSHMKGMEKIPKAQIFHTLFGTTGQAAGSILAENADKLGALNKKVEESADGQGYVATLAQKNMQTTKARLEQLRAILEKVAMSIGEAMLPAIDKAAKALEKAFNSKDGQDALKNTSKFIGEITDKAVDLFIFMGQHIEAIKIFGETLAGIWAVNRVGKFISSLRNTIGVFKELKKAAMEFKAVDAFSSMPVSGGAGGAGAVGATAAGMGASTIGSRAAGAGGAYVKGSSKVGTALNVTKGVAGVAAKYASVFGAAFTAVDLGGSVLKALSSNDAQSKYKAGAQTAGTAIGGTIGGVLGSVIPGAGTVIGAGLGATIGNELGKTGWAKKTAKKIAKNFQDAFKEHKIKPDTVTQKGALKDLSEAYKKYYTDKAKADQADIDLLHKNGLMSDDEYKKRTAEIKKEGEKANNFEKMSQADRTNITKYYQHQRQDLEEAFSKEKKKTRNKWDRKITEDAAKYGENSLQVQNDYKKKEQALDKLDSDKKKEINKLTIENVTKTTADEARLHETAAGKIKLAQGKLLTDSANLNDKSKKLSAEKLKRVEKDAKTQYETIKRYADKTFEATKKAADKKYDSVTKAADNEFNNVKKSAEDQRDAAIAAGNKQYTGTSQAAQDQRKAVVDAANQQYTNTVKAAADQHQDVYDKADKQQQDVIGAAQKQHDETVKKAKNQKNEITKKAEEQKTNVVKKSDETHTSVKKGSDGFWTQFIGGIGHALGLNAKKINSAIGGINWVLHSFGAGKETIKPLQEKYATGTGMFSNVRRPINKPTFALLNDGNDSPETGNREALVHPNGSMEIVEGQNVSRLLAPGTEVVNAKELSTLMGPQSRFAQGTGWLSSLWSNVKGAGSWVGKVAGDTWSSMSNGIGKFTKMFKYITNAVAHPVKTLSEQFSQKRDGDKGDVFNTLMDKSHDLTKNTAKDWWSTLWSMASESSSSGTGAKGDDYAFKGKSKDSGADPWGYFYRECVSFVASRLKNLGVSASLFSHLGNGSDWVNASVPHSKTPKAGDVAVYGAGSEFGNHVSMVTGVQGNKISGEEYNWGGDGQYHTYNGRNASGATTFLDFGRSAGAKAKEVDTNNPLAKLIKSQTGGMMSWIQKFIAPINDSSTGADNDVQSWSGDVKKALSKLGLSTSGSMVSKVLKQIQTESSGNAKAMGGNDGLADGNATGLMQVKPGTFRAYAAQGHNNIMNGYDNILAGLNYAKARYGSNLSFLGQGHGYANGGLITKHQIAEIGEGNQPEMIIPLSSMKSSRGYETLGQAVVAMASRDGVKATTTDDVNDNVVNALDKITLLLTQLLTQSNTPSIAYVDSKQAYDAIQAQKKIISDSRNLAKG